MAFDELITVIIVFAAMGVLVWLPYYLRNKNFLNSMGFFGFKKEELPPLPRLHIINTAKYSPRHWYTGQYKGIPVGIIELDQGYLVRAVIPKKFEGTYVISKHSSFPKDVLRLWGQKAPLEYLEFNKAFDVYAYSPEKPFYDLGPEQMELLLQNQGQLWDVVFEVEGQNLYVKNGYEQPPQNILDMAIDTVQKFMTLNNHYKIQGILDQTALIKDILNQ